MNSAPSLEVHDLSSLSSEFNTSFCAANFSGAGHRPISAQLRGANVGAVNILRYDGEGLRGGIRGIGHIRSNPTDDFVFLLPLNRSHKVTQFQNQCVLKPGSFSLISTRSPFESLCGEPPNHTLSELAVRVPASLLRERVPGADQCCGKTFSAESGIGKVMQTMIEVVLDESRYLSGTEASRMGDLLLETICLTLLSSSALVEVRESMLKSDHEVIRHRAQEFIQSNLSDPELEASVIARHCGVSRGHLHLVFSSSSMTVGAYIRENRLQQCRREIIDPIFRKQSIIQIALRWGYSNPASFARAYRLRFGKSPSEDRQNNH